MTAPAQPAAPAADGRKIHQRDASPHLFRPISFRSVTARNRIMVSPMCQYSAGTDGVPTDWHLVHLGSRAVGGAGLVMTEATAVNAEGRISAGDLGIWSEDQVAAFQRITAFIEQHGAVPAIQLAHAGRKASTLRPWDGTGPERIEEGGWQVVGPSPVAFNEGYPAPRELSTAEVRQVIDDFASGAERAVRAGFRAIEVHEAHGYLIAQFLSPFSNVRNDEYGGSEINRMRFAIEVVESVRAYWPASKPLFVRFSVEDDAGWGPDQSVTLAKILKPKGVDVIDCSSGGMRGSPVVSAGPVTYGYQVPYAERLKRDADILTMAVGLIVHADQAEQILQDGRADLIALARELLYNPNWPMDAAQKLGVDRQFGSVPPPQAYWLAKRAQSVKSVVPSTYMKGMKVG